MDRVRIKRAVKDITVAELNNRHNNILGDGGNYDFTPRTYCQSVDSTGRRTKKKKNITFYTDAII